MVYNYLWIILLMASFVESQITERDSKKAIIYSHETRINDEKAIYTK
jgi:hypothetical protein